MKYFTNCKTIEEAKKLYRRLAMENHPDRGGDLDTMKAINAEYDDFFNTFKAQHNATVKTTGARPINETPEEFRQVIEKIIDHHREQKAPAEKKVKKAAKNSKSE